MKRYTAVQLDDIPAVPCPCGNARRAFAELPSPLLSAHLVEISTDARLHYHKRLTETYVVIEGEGWIHAEILPRRRNHAQPIRGGAEIDVPLRIQNVHRRNCQCWTLFLTYIFRR